MRHTAHYVDAAETRAQGFAATDAAPRPELPDASLAQALGILGQQLQGVASCLNLVLTADRPMRERVGIDLARVEADRAQRLAQQLRTVLDEPPLSWRTIDITDLVERSAVTMTEELRLARVSVSLAMDGHTPYVSGDEQLLETGVAALLGGLVQTLESAPSPTRLHVTSSHTPEQVTIEWSVEGDRRALDPGRLSDLRGTDTPGGVAVALALTTARRIASRHGGALEAGRREADGFALRLRLPLRRPEQHVP